MDMDEWVRAAYRKHFCDKNGQRIGKVNLLALKDGCKKSRPNEKDEVMKAIKK